jgi:arylsulfatase A-like enzyme/Flp pilus assembly protein TadD
MRKEDGRRHNRPKPQRSGFSARPAIAGLLAVGLLGAAWWGWRQSVEPIRSGSCAGCNVLLVTIDTLRVDRVGAFGSARHLTPTLDRFAAEGVRLTHAYASAPLTLPSHVSIMTAVSPPVHGVRNNSLFRLGGGLPTLASLLAASGYRTGAFVGAFVLDARFGLNRGFDVYDDKYGEKHDGEATDVAERRAADVIKPALAWISQSTAGANPQSASRNPPWFAWVHLFDPHDPYRAPEPYASKYEPYDAEVAYTDAMLGALMDALRKAGQLDRTLVVVTADHGESLGEHGEATHGVFAYDVTMRVPAFIWAGPRLRGRAHDGVTRLIDLAPTVLDLLQIAGPSTFEGRSLLPSFNTGEDGPAAYIEAMDANLTRNWAPLTGLVSGTDKLIDLPIPELYNRAADPGETTNLFSRESERARALDALLRDRLAQFAARGSSEERATLNADARQRLQALGYVASAAPAGRRTYTDADDPKRLIGPSNDLNRALAAFNSGARETGMAAVQHIMRSYPQFTTAFGIFASMQRERGDLRGAIATLEDVIRRNIADQSVMIVLAGYLQEAGALDRSAALLDAVIAAHPDDAEAHNSLGVVYSRLGKHQEARAAYRRVLELDPTSAKAYENLGADEVGAGEMAAAEADLNRALALDPKLAGAHNALAAVYLRQGRSADAVAHWQTAVQLQPRMFDALYNLGTVLYDTGRRDEAGPFLARFVNEAPPARYAADIQRLRALLAK